MGDFSKWDVGDTLSGFLAGAFGGVVTMFGWFNSKLGKIHDRIDGLHGHVTQHASHIAVLQTQDAALIERLARIEEGLQENNKKQDRQMEILMDLHGRGSFSQRGQ